MLDSDKKIVLQREKTNCIASWDLLLFYVKPQRIYKFNMFCVKINSSVDYASIKQNEKILYARTGYSCCYNGMTFLEEEHKNAVG